MNDVSLKPKLSRGHRARLLMMAIGAVCGGAAAFLGGRLSDFSGLDMERLTWSDHLALALSSIMVITGVVVGVGSLNPKSAARMMDPESGSAARPAQLVLLRQQGGVMLLAGLMLAIPVLATLFVSPLPLELGVASMAVIVALMLVQTGLNFSIWNRGDEMMKGVMSEVATFCFWTMQGALFLWAAAEKLGIAPAASSWDLMSLLMAFYLLFSGVISWRRGLA